MAKVKVYEAETKPGGLIKCEKVSGSLFHTCGGHVFNTKRKDVMEWFWSFFDKDNEFIKANRNSVVFMPDGRYIPYPIENHAYMLDDDKFIPFLKDMTSSQATKGNIDNFQDFLRDRFGETLYNLYFKPYNEKVWRRDLSLVPLTWLEGKLPMPSRDEIIYNNVRRVEEKKFVHSSFWYEIEGGSQLIADRLAQNLDLMFNSPITSLQKTEDGWIVDGELFDIVVFTGNIKQLPHLLCERIGDCEWIDNLEYHGTTTVLCEIEPNPYSWIYLPDKNVEAHRIICTGNFSPSNNAEGLMTGTIEFTDYISEKDIKKEIEKIPLAKKYITHKYNQYTYPIQNRETKQNIENLKSSLTKERFYMTGRFADWEYYNMDAAIGAAIDLSKTIIEQL